MDQTVTHELAPSAASLSKAADLGGRSISNQFEGKWSIYGLFRRDKQNFGIHTTYLQEVIPGQNLTRMARSNSELSGLLSLRGDILPVLVVDSFFGIEPRGYDVSKPVLVLCLAELVVGIQVDQVLGVNSIAEEEIVSNPLSTKAPYLTGIFHRVGQDIVTLIDGAGLIDALRLKISNSAQ
jgi:chemotaxis signal transduction protein